MKLNAKFPRKVYRLILSGETVYVGSISTKSLKQRLGTHKMGYTHPILRERKDDLSIEQIDIIETEQELYKEQYWIDYYRNQGCKLLNKVSQLFISQSKEYNNQHQKEYSKKNPDKIKEAQKKWRDNNKEKIKEWRCRDKEKIKEYRRKITSIQRKRYKDRWKEKIKNKNDYTQPRRT